MNKNIDNLFYFKQIINSVYCYVLILVIFIFCFNISNSYSQSVSHDTLHEQNFRIEWVKNWSSAGINTKPKKLKDKFNRLMFGIKPLQLVNPVALTASDINDFKILDIKSKTVFDVRKGLSEVPQAVKKSGLIFNSLVGICAISNSSVLFTDSQSGKIYLWSPDKKKVQVFNDSLKLEQPTGIAYMQKKNEIWVIETRSHRIAVLNLKGEKIRTIGQRGNGKGEFNFPTHLWIDKNGYAYVNDAMNFRIQVLNSDGNVISVFGEAGDASGFFARPKGIATDSHGNIYVVDALFHVVQVFDIKGKFLYKFGGQGRGNSEFWMPTGIFIDDNDFIYIADTYNSRIQIFQLKYEGKNEQTGN